MLRNSNNRLIQRNKNLLNDLLTKHNYEIKKMTECIKQTLDGAKNTDQMVSPPGKKQFSISQSEKNASAAK